jgi:hypothetical protein
MVHEKADGVTTFTTTKAFIYLFRGGNGEGRGLFVVKRTEAKIISATFLKLYKRAYYLYNIYSTLYLLYGSRRDQKNNRNVKLKI